MKTCPECSKEHGPRKKECDCGYAFNKHPLYPEPGEWIFDIQKGMPKIMPPDPLPEGRIETEGIRDHIMYDGLGFCIYSWIPANRIKDKKLARLWMKARAEMQKIVEYLES
jgi:hypothetical protein